MSAIQRLSVALPAQMVEAVKEAVEAGEYTSTSEVIRDALRLWEDHRATREATLKALRRAWEEGKASGATELLDIDRLIAEARAEHMAERRR